MLGYEPYEGFEIYAFPHKGRDFFGFVFDGYRGWAKRTSDGKCFDGGAIHKTIHDAEDEMKVAIDILLTEERNRAEGKVNHGVSASTFFGFR